jgi:RNA polymerase sigma-70 factor (sigma-B/F/G subfamily)
MDDVHLVTGSVGTLDVLALRGELDAATAPGLREALTALLDANARDIVVDLSEVRLLDAAAVGTLVQALNLAHIRGARLRATGAYGRVLQILEVTGVAKRLDAYQRTQDLVAAAREDAGDRDAAGHGEVWAGRVSADTVAEFFERISHPEIADADRMRLRDEVIQLCLPLAEQLARRFRSRGQPQEDLTQVAVVGLVKAVDGYDRTLGYPFISYAIPTILGELRRYFRDRTWAVRAPRRVQELRLEINRVVDSLTQRLGHSPNPTEIAEHLGVDVEDVIEVVVASHGYRPMSLYQPVGRDEATELIELVGVVDGDLESVELHESLPPLIAQLPQREQRIIALRFFGNLTQTEIAGRLGISQMHVSRLLSRALATLREGLLAG